MEQLSNLKFCNKDNCVEYEKSAFDHCSLSTDLSMACLSRNNGFYLAKISSEEIESSMVFYDKDIVTQEEINLAVLCDNLRDLILYKNEKYNNSVLEPLYIFPSGEAQIGTYARINDKLGRIKVTTDEKSPLRKNDVVDLIGYLVLLCKSKNWCTFDEFKD
jgi:hypothetical protein